MQESPNNIFPDYGWKKTNQANDYTLNRTGAITGTMGSYIGRKDVKKYILTITDPATLPEGSILVSNS